ncbi:MAG TPA: hypothetical protein DER68_06630 [Ruminococcaceae bacterium]|nr:hypothetical protein [Oscillospiraceae bacterium]
MIMAKRCDDGKIMVEIKGATNEVLEECAGVILGCTKSVSKSENLPIKETFACLMSLMEIDVSNAIGREENRP